MTTKAKDSTANTLPKVNDNENPTAETLKKFGAVMVLPSAALAPTTEAGRKLGKFLTEIEAWLELPFVSPRAIAQQTELVQHGDPKAEIFLFTLHRHGETEFEREVELQDGSKMTVTEEAHLWLASAQSDLFYVNNSGNPVELKAGDSFIVSQKSGSKIRDKIANATIELLNESEIPNVTMRFAKLSAKAAAAGHSRPTTFSVVDAPDAGVIHEG